MNVLSRSVKGNSTTIVVKVPKPTDPADIVKIDDTLTLT